MDKQTIITQLTKNHTSFIDYINGLTTEELMFSYQNKWTSIQQLQHIVLCVKPIERVFSMTTFDIEQNFGKTDKLSSTYEILLSNYLEKQKEGAKAPERYVPEVVSHNQREILCETLIKSIQNLCSKIENFTEQDLDTFCIPHPSLGSLTMREMLYNVIYHVEHHQNQDKQNLQHLI
ncbi:MAG: hypothetical protein RJA07_906 [Bacteroidota bacterium]|jgi:hypothetical protein